MTGVLAAEFLLDDGTSVHVLGELVVIGKDGKHATLPVTSAAFLSRVLVSIDELHRPQSVAATPAPSVGEDAARTSASPAAGRPPGVAESSPPSSSATPARAHTRVSSPVGTPREVAAALARRPRRASSGH